jgi:hypothetical protein
LVILFQIKPNFCDFLKMATNNSNRIPKEMLNVNLNYIKKNFIYCLFSLYTNSSSFPLQKVKNFKTRLVLLLYIK